MTLNLCRNINTKSMSFFIFAAFLLLATGFASTAKAQVTIGQFIQQGGGSDFRFVNNTTSGDFETIPTGSLVTFQYFNVTVDPELQGNQDAILTMTGTTTSTATLDTNTVLQPVNGTLTIAIIRTNPASTGSGSRTNLLTVVIEGPFNPAPPNITGANGGNSGAFSATTPDHTITFTSDFVDFSSSLARNAALSFSGLTPSMSINPNGFANSWVAAGTGTFGASFPTAASTSVSGRILKSNGFGLGRVNLELRDVASGSVYHAQTRGDGSFVFNGVPVGGNYILTPKRKRYVFAPDSIVISLFDEISGIQIFGNPRR